MLYCKWIGIVGAVALCAEARCGYEVIALAGQAAPGTGGATFRSPGTVGVSDSGEVAFWSTLSGVSSSADTAVFRSVGGVLEKVVQENDPFMGFTLDGPGVPTLGGSGALGVVLRYERVGGVNFDSDYALWADTGSGLQAIVREGDAAPGLGGAVFDRPGDALFNGAGSFAFAGRLKEGVGGVTDDNDSAIWAKPLGGAVKLVAREGEPAPDIAGGVFGFTSTPSMNLGGDVVFGAQLRSDGARGGVDTTNDSGIWVRSGGTTSLVVREGDPSPIAGAQYGTLYNRVHINSGGQLLGHTTLRGEGVENSNDEVLFKISGGTEEIVAREGDAAPGAGGAPFVDMIWSDLNDAGHVVFGGSIDTGVRGSSIYDMGIWADHGSGLEALIITGDTAPGTDGARFNENGAPIMNNNGDIVFRSSLVIEGDVTFDNADGLWAYDHSVNELFKVAREGDEFQVAPGDVRVISFIDVQGTGVEGFEPTQALNDAGQIALRLSFDDGTSGTFLFTIPTPGTAMLLAIGGAVTLRHRRA